MALSYETYQATPEKHGEGTFFFTDCGNTMYSVRNDYMAYHGCYCPKCMSQGKQVLLYMRGTKEAQRLLEVKYEDTKEIS